MTISTAGELVVCLAATAMWLTARYRRRTIMLLRHCVVRACETCEKCAGHGIVALPGATVKCTRCGAWRAQLKASEHWLNG